jgi:mRNA interferase MazF
MTRGEIWWADLGLPFGSEPGFRRLVLIVQDDAFNRSRIGTVVILPLTTSLSLGSAPGNVLLRPSDSGLSKDSVAVVSQITAIDRQRLVEVAGKLSRRVMGTIEEGMKLVVGLD